ncbi:TetR/AcrR family transcriptional regulator [Streptomyces sp. NPDC101175]|uniref:TetR/AcrR family transcriptional regulator n=1 Tax=Streptomyces sp. NPDC101175 TaxID=3366123 RepID=UPI0038327D59
MHTDTPSTDRRVRRSRAALMAATVRVVSERGTTAVAVTDLAEAAQVSRQLVYLQFGDRDALLVAAAADLVRRELAPHTETGSDPVSGALALTRHFAEHRDFYRAMLTGSCAFAMTRTLNDLFGVLNRSLVRERFGVLDEATVDDVAAFVAGGTGAIVNAWLLGTDDPLDPEDLAARLRRLAAVFRFTAVPAAPPEVPSR